MYLNTFKPRDFEDEVKEKLLDIMSAGETLSVGGRFLKSRLYCDFKFPNGCRELNLEEDSAVEIRSWLTTDLLFRIYRKLLDYEKDHKIKNGCKYVVVCEDCYLERTLLEKITKDVKALKICTFSELFGVIGKEISSHKTMRNSNSNDVLPANNSDDKAEVINDSLANAKDLFADNNCTLFLGAGLSMDADMPSWNKLLESLLVQKDGMPFKYLNEASADAIN